MRIGLSISLTAALAPHAHAFGPASMGALGDSISAAAFGNWRRTDAQLPWNQQIFFDQLVAYKLLGDDPRSIERRSMSWTTGNDRTGRVVSHAQRLAFLNPDEPFFSYNASVTGALARELRFQLPRLRQWSEAKLGAAAPDYVTILIGGNDLCADRMTPTAEFAADIAQIVDELLADSPQTRVLVNSVPKLERLSAIVRDAEWSGKRHLRTCRELLQLTQVCRNVTLADAPARIAEIATRVREYHEALRELVEERRVLHGDRVRFASALFEQELGADDLSIDCFHPGVSGQARLADATFAQSWWSGEWEQAKSSFPRRSPLAPF